MSLSGGRQMIIDQSDRYNKGNKRVPSMFMRENGLFHMKKNVLSGPILDPGGGPEISWRGIGGSNEEIP